MVDKWPNAMLNWFQTVPNPMLFIHINLFLFCHLIDMRRLISHLHFFLRKFFNEIVKPIEPFSRMAYLHN